MNIFTFVSEAKKPWIFSIQRPVIQQDIPSGILLLELDGASMITLKGLYREFSSALRFPDYFGNNFNALDECITDLEWLPADGYLLCIRNSEFLLKEEPGDVLEGLLSILNNAGNEWATPIVQGETWDREGIPFHTVLALDKRKTTDFELRLKKIGFEIPSL